MILVRIGIGLISVLLHSNKRGSCVQLISTNEIIKDFKQNPKVQYISTTDFF